MTFPLELGYGNFKISAHLLCETLAFIVGYRYYVHLRKQRADVITDPNRVWILIGAAAGAFFFSRLIGVLEAPMDFFTATHPLLYFYANKTIVGALLGGLLGVEIIKLWIGEKASSGDLFTYPLILAMIIGRIGCFTSGIYEPTYGVATTLPWGINLGDGISRHPIALYEILFLLVLWWALYKAEKRGLPESGIVFRYFLISYLVFRFTIDFIKPTYRHSFGLTTIQICCILGLIYYTKTIFSSVIRVIKAPHA